MKILLLANHFNTGGISTYLLTLAKGYVQRGHEVIMATSGGDCVAEAEALGVRHVEVPALRVKCEFHPSLLSAASVVCALVKEQGIDILHPQTRVTQVVAAMAGAWSGRPYVSTCHGFFKPRFSRRILPLWGQIAIAISHPVAEHLIRELKINAVKVVFVPNGIDTERFHPLTVDEKLVLRERFDMGMSPCIGIIARLSDVKGHCHLIDAMNELVHRMPGVKCLIVGEGPLEDRLKEQVKALKLGGAVIFSSMCGRSEEMLPMFDVFALPSLQEGLGLSAMEAESCGVPVVASRVGGLVEAVNDGETGILVAPRDHFALADALEKILANKDLARRFGHNAREWVKAKFSIDDMVDKTLQVYRGVLRA